MNMFREKKRKKEISKIICLLISVMVVLFAIPLSAKEKIKIKLPDGLYLYDAIVSQSKGNTHIGFQKYFVVRNNIIYGQREAVKKFGFKKLNEMFVKNKKHKIILAGEKVGEIYITGIDNEGDCAEGCISYKLEISSKNLKERPAYGRGGYGSAVNYIVVPEEYKEIPRKVYNTITQDEVNKIAKLVKEKLFELVKNRKEVTEYRLKHTELSEEYIELLDKISNRSGDLYLGVYRYIFKIEKGSRKFTPFLVFALEIAFSVMGDNVYLITSGYDGEMAIYGMLDFDGCGVDELFIEKMFSTEDTATITKEIYKQKSDSNWLLIKKIMN